jgi:toxin ParE1/3/4
MAEYQLTPAAERDLQAIWKYTAAHWGVEQADRYTDHLVVVFAELAKSPKTSSACDHIRPGYRRRIVERHMIYFRITSEGVVTIVRILHDRMDATRHI